MAGIQPIAYDQIYSNQEFVSVEFSKPSLDVNRVYYGTPIISPGPGGERVMPSLSAISGLLDEMLAIVEKNANPEAANPSPTLAERVGVAKQWLAYAEPGGQFQTQFLEAIELILSKSF